MPTTRQEAAERLQEAIPAIRIAVEMAKIANPGGSIELAVATYNADRTGRVTACLPGFEEFLNDIEAVLAPATAPDGDAKVLLPWEPSKQYPGQQDRYNGAWERIATIFPEGLGTSQCWCWRIKDYATRYDDCAQNETDARSRVDAVLMTLGYK
jgi:hypothetical protein